MVLSVALAVSGTVAVLEGVRGAGYTAESLVLVRETGTGGPSGVSAERIGEIRSAAGAERVSRSAAREAGWEAGFGEFNRRLEVVAGDGGELGVTFSADSPEMAARGANAYAAAFVDRVESLNAERLAGGSLDAGAEIVREAEAPPGSSLQPLRAALLALVPGLAAGCALALVFGKRRWRDAREAELALGAPVLGVIPERTAVREGDVVREP